MTNSAATRSDDLPALPAAVVHECSADHEAFLWSSRDLPTDIRALILAGSVGLIFFVVGIIAFTVGGVGSQSWIGTIFGLFLAVIFLGIGVILMFVVLRSRGHEFLYVDDHQIGWGWRTFGMEFRRAVPLARVDRLLYGKAMAQENPEMFVTLSLYHRPVQSRQRKREQLLPTVSLEAREVIARHFGAAISRRRPSVHVDFETD